MGVLAAETLAHIAGIALTWQVESVDKARQRLRAWGMQGPCPQPGKVHKTV